MLVLVVAEQWTWLQAAAQTFSAFDEDGSGELDLEGDFLGYSQNGATCSSQEELAAAVLLCCGFSDSWRLDRHSWCSVAT